MMDIYQKKAYSSTHLSTTCFFHSGGFTSILDIAEIRVTYIFNHGGDLDDGNVSQIIYKVTHSKILHLKNKSSIFHSINM